MKASALTQRVLACAVATTTSLGALANDAHKLAYNHPGLTVDLGVGLWGAPIPLDHDGDGDRDLLVVSMGKVGNGTYLFENPGGDDPMPTFKPGVRIGPGPGYAHLTWDHSGAPRVFDRNGNEYVEFLDTGFGKTETLDIDFKEGFEEIVKPRAQYYGFVDYNGDGIDDLFRAVGDWGEYGWDDAYDDQGNWTHGPLRSWIYVLINRGSNETPHYDSPKLLSNDAGALDVYGAPCPNFRDFDNDGDLDLLCGEFIDSFTYFENTGSRQQPVWSDGRKLTSGDRVFRVALCMFQFVAMDWDDDGVLDLVIAEEDGRVSWAKGTGVDPGGTPQFQTPKYFQQEAQYVKFGVLSTPYVFDWDNDGDQDILSGNTAGEIGFIENLGGDPIRWQKPRRLHSGDRPIQIQAGPNGSIQGPAEKKWGYTTLSVGLWDDDGIPDILVNSILGEPLVYLGTGRRSDIELARALPIQVGFHPRLWTQGTSGADEATDRSVEPAPAWSWKQPRYGQLITQWRTTPLVADVNRDGLNDLVMLDSEGFLALYSQETLRLPPILPGDDDRWFSMTRPSQRRFFLKDGDDVRPLRLNDGWAGKSGRRKLAFLDWDGDGSIDLLANGANAEFYRNVSEGTQTTVFVHEGPISEDNIASHSSSPAGCDFDDNGVPDLLIGAEDGFFYHYTNPHDPYRRR